MNGERYIMNTQKKGMTGKDIITVGIFSAIYFVINFAFMLLSGLHPLLWILMPGLIAIFAGIPFLMMCTKVPKTGAVVLMGFITALIYFVTGQFTVVILIAFAVSCILAIPLLLTVSKTISISPNPVSIRRRPTTLLSSK